MNGQSGVSTGGASGLQYRDCQHLAAQEVGCCE